MGLFDVVTSRGIYHQLRATQFVATPGKILSSKVESNRGGDSTTYLPKVTYEYKVDDQTLRGEIVRYGEVSSNDSYAHEFVADHPVGAMVDVHYDSSNPSDAVLITGIEGFDLFMLMFLTPFNVIMVGGWYFLASTIKQLVVPASLIRPCRYIDHGYEIRIMVNRVSLIAVIGVCLLALCFVSVFIVGFGAEGFRPSWSAMLTVWSIIFSITALITTWFAIRNWSGGYDIVVDRFDQKVTLPATNKRNQEVTLSFKDIEQVYVDSNVKIDSDGDRQETFFVRMKTQPHKKAVDKFKNVETLVKFHDGDKAYRFADWFDADVLKRRKTQSVH